MPEFTLPYGYSEASKAFPTYELDRHLCTFGATRSGKGATSIVQTLLLSTRSFIVIDPKGQNAAITARRRREMGQDVNVLNPFGMHVTAPWHLPKHRFNPLAHLDIASENIVADVASLAEALIVNQGKEPYFEDTARDLVKAVILHLIATLGRAATLGDMRRRLTRLAARGPDGAALLVAMGNSPHSFVRDPIGRFKDPDARDIASAINTAITQTSFLDDPALCDPARGGTLTGSDFSFTRLKHRPTTVYVILPGKYLDAYARFFRLIITSAIDQLTSETGGHPVVMLLDEFARLRQLPAVSQAFGFAAGYNLQLWPFLQDMPQLKQIYGEGWETFLANAGLVQFYTPCDLTTAEYLQKRGGITTGHSTNRSYAPGLLRWTRSVSSNETRVPLLPMESTMSLRSDEQLVFFAGKHDPVIVGRKPYWEIPRLKGMFDRDPFH